MRGAGIYGGRAPEPVADPGELSREMDRIEPEEPEADDWIPGGSAATWVPDMAEELEAGG